MNQIERLQNLIVRVGDEGPSFYVRDIKKLTDQILENFNNLSEEHKQEFHRIFIECICYQTEKQMIYATVTCLLDLKLPQLSNSLIDQVLEKLQKQLDLGQMIQAKYLIIYLGELMNIGLINSFQFITLLFDLVNEAEKSIEDSQDYYLNIVVGVLPTLYHGLMEKSKIEFKSLLQTLQQLMAKRDLKYIKYLGFDNQNLQKDQLYWLWKFISEDQLPQDDIRQIYENFQKEFKLIKQIRKGKKIYFNNKDKKACVYFSPDLIQNSTFQNANQIIQYISIYELTNIFKDNQKILITKLFEINTKFNNNQLIFQVLQLKKGGFKLNVGYPKFNQIVQYLKIFNYCINNGLRIEFQQFGLKICKNKQLKVQNFMEYVFKNYQIFDNEVQQRIVIFFSFYLINIGISNFDFTEINAENQQQQNFLRQIILKIDKLVPRKQLQEELPDKLQTYISEQDIYVLNYYDSNSNSYADAEIIMDKINSKLSDQEMINFLTNQNSQLESTSDELVNIFMECFYFKTKQTLAHLNIILQRYENTLKSLININKENNQINLLNSMLKFWKSNWHLCLYIDKFFEAKLLKLQIILNWIFKQFEKETDKENNFQIQFLLMNQVLNNYLNLQLTNNDINQEIQHLKNFFKVQINNLRNLFKYFNNIKSNPKFLNLYFNN